METCTHAELKVFNLKEQLKNKEDENFQALVPDCNFCQNCDECVRIKGDLIKGFRNYTIKLERKKTLKM